MAELYRSLKEMNTLAEVMHFFASLSKFLPLQRSVTCAMSAADIAATGERYAYRSAVSQAGATLLQFILVDERADRPGLIFALSDIIAGRSVASLPPTGNRDASLISCGGTETDKILFVRLAASMSGFCRHPADDYYFAKEVSCVYCSVNRSVLEYACPVWHRHKLSQDVKRTQVTVTDLSYIWPWTFRFPVWCDHTKMFQEIKNPKHPLHYLLPPVKVCNTQMV